MINRDLLQKISNKAASKAEPFLDRWTAFASKLSERSREIAEEAEGIDDIVSLNPTDYGPIAAAFSAVKGRYHGLSNKVDKAIEKLESEWDEIFDDMDLKDKELERVGTLWSQIVNESRALQATMERDAQYIEVKKGADWARTLLGLAQNEMNAPSSCPQCGGPLQTSLRWRNTNLSCPHCNAVNELLPLPVTAVYYGSGLHNLAMEAAWDDWVALEKAEAAYHDLRHPGTSDKERYVLAAEKYWTTYYSFYNSHHPEPARTIQQSVAAKVGHYRTNVWDEKGIEAREHSRIATLLELVSTGNKEQARSFFKENPGIDIEEATRATYERHDKEGTRFLLALQYEIEKGTTILLVTTSGISISELPAFEEWKKKRFHELDLELANR